LNFQTGNMPVESSTARKVQGASDYGANGAATLTRKAIFEQVASGETRIGHEKCSRVRYEDCHLIDQLYAAHVFTTVQRDAALQALQMFTDAGLARSRVARIGQGRGGPETFDDADIAEPRPADHYRWLARNFGYRWALVEQLLIGQYCGPVVMINLKGVLNDLAAYWGIT
jgi:hypothetical protein